MLLVRLSCKDVVIIALSQGERRRECQPLAGLLALLTIRCYRNEGKPHHDDPLKPPEATT